MSNHVYRAGPYVLMVLLALIEPLTHLWILGAAPEGAVATGVHTGDSSHPPDKYGLLPFRFFFALLDMLDR